MKFTLNTILLGFILIAYTVRAQKSSCDTILSPYANQTTTFNGLLAHLNPGSTICLEKGNYYQLRFDNIEGDSVAPIVIRPKDEKVTIVSDAHYGVRFGRCSNIKFIGNSLDSTNHDIYISKIKGNAISIDDFSTDITISGIEVYDVAICGIMAKTDPNCSFNSVRDSFLLKNMTIENCKFVKTATEGLYIGNSFFAGYTINCNGKDTIVLPHLLSNITIRNNLFDSTGYDGIQITSALLGCKIYGNKIFHDSQVERYGQMSGIIIGGGSLAECYNNYIADGKGIGIEVHGTGGTRIFNNVIVNTGLNYHPGEHGTYGKSGIMIMYNLFNPNLLPYTIASNTIVSPKTEGIRFSNIQSSNNIIKNNLIVNPGAFDLFTSQGFPYSTSFLNFNVNVTADCSNNSFIRDIDSVGFLSYSTKDYQLITSSPVIDAGQDLRYIGIDFDYLNNPRPFNGKFDVGAFEYTPTHTNEEDANNLLMKCYFKGKEKLIVDYQDIRDASGKLEIVDMNGSIQFEQVFTMIKGINTIQLKKSLDLGIYIIRFRSNFNTSSQKIAVF